MEGTQHGPESGALRDTHIYRGGVEGGLVRAQGGEVRRHPLGIGGAVHGEGRQAGDSPGQPLVP